MLKGLRRRRLVHLVVVVAVVGAVVGLAVTRSGVPASAMRLLTGDAWLANASAGTVSHVNGYSGDVDAQVSVAKPGDPFTVVQRNGGAYAFDQRTGRYIRIGDSGLDVTTTATTKARPAKSLQLVMGSGVLWSLDTSSGVLQRLNSSTLKPIGHQVALGGPTGTPVADGSGSVWVPVPKTGGVAQVTPDRRVSHHAFGREGDGIQVAVTSGGVWAVDPQRQIAGSLSVPGTPQVNLPGLAPAPLVAASSSGPNLAVVSGGRVFDVNTQRSSLSSVVLPPSSGSATQVVVSSNRAYVLTPSSHRLATVNLASAKVASSTPVPPAANQLIAKDNLVFVNSTTTAQALVVSPNGSVTPVQKYRTDRHKKVPTTVPKTTPTTVPKTIPSTLPVPEPPLTEPPLTEPPVTDPPVTEPPVPPTEPLPTVPPTFPPPPTPPPTAPPTSPPTAPPTAPPTMPSTLPPPTHPILTIPVTVPRTSTTATTVPPTTTTSSTTTTTTTTVPATTTTTTTVPATTTTTEAPTVPGRPTVSQVVAGDGQLTVTWSAPPSDGGSPITEYEVTGSPTSETVTASPSATSATLTGLPDGTSECVQVQALNKVGGGPLTGGQACATPNPPPAAPGPVADLSVAAGNGELTVSWTAASVQSGSPAITGYELQLGSGTPQAATSGMIVSVPAWTSETVTVYAVNSVGNGKATSTSGTAWGRSNTVTCTDTLSGDVSVQNSCVDKAGGGDAWQPSSSSITWINAQMDSGAAGAPLGHTVSGNFEYLCSDYVSSTVSGNQYALVTTDSDQACTSAMSGYEGGVPNAPHIIAAVSTSSLGSGSQNICEYSGKTTAGGQQWDTEELIPCGTTPPSGLAGATKGFNFWT